MKIENRQQFLILLTIAAAALLIGNTVVYEPLVKFWSARSAQITNLKNQVRDGNILIQNEAVLRRRWSDMSANALPANTSLAESQMITALTTWARGSGADLTKITPQWKNDSTNYMTLNCRVEATGTLGTLSQFLYDVERGPMGLKSDSVELMARENTQQLTLVLDVSGLALLQPTTQVKR